MHIGALHEFHDTEYARNWAERFKENPARQQLFSDIGDLLEKQIPANGKVIELGIGPGFLAAYLMKRFPSIEYIGFDFSKAMLMIASERLEEHQERFKPLLVNLVEDQYEELFGDTADAIVSTWALHDLFTPENIQLVYSKCRAILSGILINGDFIKPDGSSYAYEGGRFEVKKHLRMLEGLGYQGVRCAGLYEENVEAPTAANNYACIVGVLFG